MVNIVSIREKIPPFKCNNFHLCQCVADSVAFIPTVAPYAITIFHVFLGFIRWKTKERLQKLHKIVNILYKNPVYNIHIYIFCVLFIRARFFLASLSVLVCIWNWFLAYSLRKGKTNKKKLQSTLKSWKSIIICTYVICAVCSFFLQFTKAHKMRPKIHIIIFSIRVHAWSFYLLAYISCVTYTMWMKNSNGIAVAADANANADAEAGCCCCCCFADRMLCIVS